MKIIYCVEPQTVLTVQKENAFFAASISTSATLPVLDLWIAQDSVSSSLTPPNQTIQQMDRPKRQASSNTCCWRSCWGRKSSGLARRGDMLITATAAPTGGFLESARESPEHTIPVGPTPGATPRLFKDGVLLGAPPPKGTRATSAHRYHLYPPCANMRITETNYELEESRRRWQGLSPLHISAQECPPHAAYGSSLAWSTNPCSVCEL